jgi:hypothetical protein
MAFRARSGLPLLLRAFSSLAASRARAPVCFVKPGGGHIVAVPCAQGDNISHLRNALPDKGISSQSDLYQITSDVLWTNFKASPNAEKTFQP